MSAGQRNTFAALFTSAGGTGQRLPPAANRLVYMGVLTRRRACGVVDAQACQEQGLLVAPEIGVQQLAGGSHVTGSMHGIGHGTVGVQLEALDSKPPAARITRVSRRVWRVQRWRSRRPGCVLSAAEFAARGRG